MSDNRADPEQDRATDAEISEQYGAAEIGTFRNVYGDEFAKDFEPLNKLADALAATGDKALAFVHRLALRRDHRDGSLAKKLVAAARSPASRSGS